MSSITERRTTIKEVTIGQKCDHCGLEHINEQENTRLRSWFQFSTGHNGWGNDSFESLEYFDACSAKCFIEIAKKELSGRLKGEGTATIAGMSHGLMTELIALTQS